MDNWRDRFFNEAETVKIPRDKLDKERARAEAAEAEVARLREELEVTRDLLRDAPILFQDDAHQPWCDAVSDYLETLDNSGQDAAGG